MVMLKKHYALPPDMPEPLGKEVDICMMVDSDHAGDKTTRRSWSGILIFVNNALVDWLSKRQPTIETAVFGAEFVAMKLGIERLRGLAPHVADIAKCRQILADIACRCDTEESPTHPIFLNYSRQVQVSPNVRVSYLP